MKRASQTIDASQRSLGRLAGEIALVLRGKNKADFAPYKDEGDIVVIKNVDQLKITGKKLTGKIYYRHSGYPGGFRKERLEEVIAKKGMKEVLKRAVWGMLPKNKLRAEQIKRLKFN